MAGASRSFAPSVSATIHSSIELPSSGHDSVSITTSVAPIRSSPWRRPSALNTSLVATGTQGLTSTDGILGGLSGNSFSPTPVMSQAREARHTGTSAPTSSATSCSRSSSSERLLSRASRRSAAAASAEPPPMPPATGNILSSTKAPVFNSGTTSPSSRAAFSTRLSGSSPQAIASGPTVFSVSSGPGVSVSLSAQSANATTLSRSW